MNYQKVVKIDKVLTILNQRGLHARAAAKFTETIAAFSCEVTVSKNNETVSGSSIMKNHHILSKNTPHRTPNLTQLKTESK